MESVSENEIFKLTEEKSPKGLKVALRRGMSYGRLIPDIALYLSQFWRIDSKVKSFRPHPIPQDFFGINIVAGTTEEHDRYVLARLKELGVRSVRIDYGYHQENSKHAARLIPKLKAEGFRVLLHLVQPIDDAYNMGSEEADAKWSAFLEETLAQFKNQIDEVELGSTPNRFTWSGYTTDSYLRTCKIGHEICQRHGIDWYGPNVSDFSPAYNVGILSRLKKQNTLPKAHTDNLFVDRVGQPENADPKVFPYFSERLDFDLVRKARFFAIMSRFYGVPQTISTYNYWTLDVKDEQKARYVDENTYADYLVRYMVLALACGHLERVYWGQMISHAKGLIGDESGVKPRIPTVHHQWTLFGDLENYNIRPGFWAFANLTKVFEKSKFVCRLKTSHSTFALEFVSNQGTEQEAWMVIAWCRDGVTDDLADWFSERLKDVQSINNIRNEAMPLDKFDITPSPIIIHYVGGTLRHHFTRDSMGYLGRLTFPPKTQNPYRYFANEEYRGVLRSDLINSEMDWAFENPERLWQQRKSGPVRNLKMFKWKTEVGVKEFVIRKLPPTPRALLKKRSKAMRVWNAKAHALEKDIPVLPPVMMIEKNGKSQFASSYILSELPDGYQSLRQFLKVKKASLPAKKQEVLFTQLGEFIRTVHKAGIQHRDLNKGNILIREVSQNQFQFILSNSNHLRFFRRLSWTNRYQDLVRLSFEDHQRKLFFLAYHNCDRKKANKHWPLYSLFAALYRSKFNLRNPKRFLANLSGAMKKFEFLFLFSFFSFCEFLRKSNESNPFDLVFYLST